MKKPIVLAILLYLLIYFIRVQQGGWDLKVDPFSNFRASLDKQIETLLPSPEAELLSGILLGEKKNLPSDLKLNFRDTSTLHIVVASGQNLSLVAGFFLLLSGLIKPRVAIILTLASIIFYLCLTGLQVPILRAAVMFLFASMAKFYGKQRDGTLVLIATGGLMLLINPSWLTDISFQLSFLATFGVIVVSPILLEHFKKVPIVSQDLAVSLAAQLMVTPIIAANFHQFSIVGLVTNLLILWTVPIIMLLGGIMVIVNFLFVPLAQLISLPTNVLLTYFIYVVQFFGSLSFAWEYIGEFHWIFWMGYYLLLAGVLILLYDKKSVSKRLAEGS
jgi:competence protein ComEC